MIGHNASEGIEPRNSQRCTGPRVSFPGSQYRCTRHGECAAACRGLRPWQVIERNALELGRAMPLPTGSVQQAEEARRRHGGVAVGLTRSRGVAGVMSGGGMEPTRRGER